MVLIRRYLGLAAVLSTLNSTIALPRPGNEVSQQNSYGSSKDNNNNYGSNSNSGYNSGSSKDQNNSGYNSDSNNSGYNSGYNSGSNNSGYNNGSNNSGYNNGSNNNGYKNSQTTTSSQMKETSTSTMKSESTSTTMLESSSSMMSESSTMLESSSMMSESSTSTSAASTSTMYGSGSMNSGSSSNPYNDCVAQCIASFSPPSATAPSVNSGSSGSVGTGATKTVIVAPSQGVLRYVPFATNASVGDTIKFIWKAGPHTVTKGSSLQPCNASADVAFDSSKQNVGFEFTQEVTTTDPTFYFCGVPGHCQKGMYGVINPPSNLNAPTSASGMMQSLKANNSDLKAYAAITDAATQGTAASVWGGNIDMANMPDWSQPLMAANILYTRNVLAANPELLKEDGSIDMSSVDTVPMMVPKDMADALKDAAAAAPAATAANTANSTAIPPANAAGAANTAAPTTTTSGASLTSPRAVMALFAVAATVLMI